MTHSNCRFATVAMGHYLIVRREKRIRTNLILPQLKVNIKPKGLAVQRNALHR